MTNIRLKEATLLTNEKKLPVSKYISNNGLKSHYADWEGAGPTTLLVHGNMRTSRSFDAVSRNLSADHHVIAMDLIGHGNSTWAKQGYKLQDRCEDIGNFVNKNNLNNIFAVGHSMGAVGLAMLVANDDSRFDKLVLLEPMMEIQSRFHRPESERTPRHRRTWNDHTELYKLLKKDHNVIKIKSTQVTLDFLHKNEDANFIVANFIQLSEECKQSLQKKKKYIIYEHDHKYVRTRNPADYPNYTAPKEELVNYCKEIYTPLDIGVLENVLNN